MAQPAKQITETEYVANRIAKDRGMRESLRQSLEDLKKGRVVSHAEVLKRLLKKRA